MMSVFSLTEEDYEENDELSFFSDDEESDDIAARLATLGIDENAELSADEDEDMKEIESAGTDYVQEQTEQPNEVDNCNKEKQDEQSAQGTPAATAVAPPTAVSGHSYEEQPPTKLDNTDDKGREDAAGPSVISQATRNAMDAPLPTSRGNKRKRNPKGGSGGGGGGGEGREGADTLGGLAATVCKKLKERKYYLMCRIVALLGKKKTKRLLMETRQIEEAGGMWVEVENRRRTPGGVFLTLLKTRLSADKLKEVYADDAKYRKKAKRVKQERTRERERKRVAAAALAEQGVSAEAGGDNEEGAVDVSVPSVLDVAKCNGDGVTDLQIEVALDITEKERGGEHEEEGVVGEVTIAPPTSTAALPAVTEDSDMVAA